MQTGDRWSGLAGAIPKVSVATNKPIIYLSASWSSLLFHMHCGFEVVGNEAFDWDFFNIHLKELKTSHPKADHSVAELQNFYKQTKIDEPNQREVFVWLYNIIRTTNNETKDYIKQCIARMGAVLVKLTEEKTLELMDLYAETLQPIGANPVQFFTPVNSMIQYCSNAKEASTQEKRFRP